MRKQQIQIFSIFGQIEAVAAEIMMKNGLARRIGADLIPATVRYNERGEQAQFGIVIRADAVPAFDKHISDLRA